MLSHFYCAECLLVWWSRGVMILCISDLTVRFTFLAGIGRVAAKVWQSRGLTQREITRLPILSPAHKTANFRSGILSLSPWPRRLVARPSTGRGKSRGWQTLLKAPKMSTKTPLLGSVQWGGESLYIGVTRRAGWGREGRGRGRADQSSLHQWDCHSRGWAADWSPACPVWTSPSSSLSSSPVLQVGQKISISTSS